MFGDGGTALLFRSGTYRNIRVRNITTSTECRHPLTDDNPSEHQYNRRKLPEQPVEENRVYTVYFQGSTIRNLTFDGITAGMHVNAVFGGFGDVEFKARDIFLQNDATPISDTREGIIAKIS